jgi:hypothetical protein
MALPKSKPGKKLRVSSPFKRKGFPALFYSRPERERKAAQEELEYKIGAQVNDPAQAALGRRVPTFTPADIEKLERRHLRRRWWR